MKVLVVGKGAREHALCWRLNQSPSVWGIWAAGGNPGINQIAKPVPLELSDHAGLAAFALTNKIDLTIVGPEASLCAGGESAMTFSASASVCRENPEMSVPRIPLP